MSRTMLAVVIALVAGACSYPYPGDYETDGGGPPTCGNGSIEEGEDCDGEQLGDSSCFALGHVSGELRCTSACVFDVSECYDCGNFVIEGVEVCDGAEFAGETCEGRGYDRGALACSPDCLSFDESACTSCGDGVREGAETCDAGDLGGATCQSEGFVDGALGCADDCMSFDVSGCNATLPTVPRLRLPMNNTYEGAATVAGSRRPRFVWEASTWSGPGTVSYDLQFGTDPTFAVGTTTVTGAATAHRPAADLPVQMVAPVGTRYFWRVRACVGAACSAYSSPWKLNLGRSPRDLNGDGFADLVVGAQNNDAGGTDAGRVYIYFGGPGSTLDPTVDATLTGGAAGDAFGASVGFAGDVNGDGFGDLIVGAPGNDAGGMNAGRAYVFLGGPGASFDPTIDGTLTGANTADAFGVSVGTAGDVNGDGFDDVIVGANQTMSAPGRAYVFLGGAGVAFDATPDGTLAGQVNGDYFGYSVATAGDVNGDGFADVVVGAFVYGSGAGRAYVFRGGAGAFDVTADDTLTGNAANDYFGIAVAGAGDVNGDGFADLIVGADGSDVGGSGAGQAFVYFGASTGIEPTPDGTLTGAAAGDTFGRSVAGAGDVNGDGFADVVVGAFNSDAAGAFDAGRAYVYLGGAGTSLNSTADGTLTGNILAEDYFGRAVASAGDVNGDGFADVVAGAPGSDSSASNAGRVFVYFGAAGASFNATADGSPAGAAMNDNYGSAVAR